MVKAELICTTHIADKQSKIPVTIQLTNPTILPISFVKLNITYGNSYTDKKHKKTIYASLDYKTKASVIFHINSQYACNLNITLHHIRIYDYMKIFSLKKKLNQEINVAILPAYYELPDGTLASNDNLATDNDVYSPIRKGDDPSEVFEIREYREGDRMQRVHWKLSMKQNQLMIKEFSDPVNCRELVFVDLNAVKQDSLPKSIDSALECALSLSYSLLQRNHVHYLAWYESEHEVCRRVRVTKEEDLFEAVEGLLHTKVYKGKEDSLSAYAAEFPHDHFSNLFFVSNSSSKPKLNSLAIIKAIQKHIICMVEDSEEEICDAEHEETLKTYLENGITFLPVSMDNISNDIQQFGME